jgi:hypothetical protein
MKIKLKVLAVALMTGVALIGLSSCQRQQASALKPIDKAALQTMMDTTAKELLIQSSEFIERKPLMIDPVRVSFRSVPRDLVKLLSCC